MAVLVGSWKLSELPAVSDFVLLLRDKVLDGRERFLDPLLAAVTLCSKVRRSLAFVSGHNGDANLLVRTCDPFHT